MIHLTFGIFLNNLVDNLILGQRQTNDNIVGMAHGVLLSRGRVT